MWLSCRLKLASPAICTSHVKVVRKTQEAATCSWLVTVHSKRQCYNSQVEWRKCAISKSFLMPRISCFVNVHLITIFISNQLDVQLFFLYLFIPILYMFRAAKRSSSGETIVSIRPLVYVTLCRWPCGMQVWMELNKYKKKICGSNWLFTNNAEKFVTSWHIFLSYICYLFWTLLKLI